MRDEFSEDGKRVLALRAANRCSGPACRALTSGPQLDPSRAVNVGVAAHVTAASPGGPRYDPELSPAQRTHPENGIWLCQNCAKLVDNDQAQFPAAVLRAWKHSAELEASQVVGRTAGDLPASASGPCFHGCGGAFHPSKKSYAIVNTGNEIHMLRVEAMPSVIATVQPQLVLPHNGILHIDVSTTDGDPLPELTVTLHFLVQGKHTSSQRFRLPSDFSWAEPLSESV